MSNTLRSVRKHVQSILLLVGRGPRRMWAEFYVENGEGRLRYLVQRNGRVGVWDSLVDACADYDREIEATSFLVPEGVR